MENSLREEREAFKKRARQMVAVEKRKAPLNDDSHSHKKQKAEREWTTPKSNTKKHSIFVVSPITPSFILF